jgi:hypothetical protein
MRAVRRRRFAQRSDYHALPEENSVAFEPCAAIAVDLIAPGAADGNAKIRWQTLDPPTTTLSILP